VTEWHEAAVQFLLTVNILEIQKTKVFIARLHSRQDMYLHEPKIVIC
jgi:hypothetical protein